MKTFSRWPPLTMMFSAVLEPWQLESWLMSILAGLGAAPSNFTVPLTRAAVAGSIVVDAGAAAGVGPENVQRLFSRLKRPEGMEVPGLMACGSIIQRSTQSGLRRPLACRKLGAVAVLSCAGSPVAWHFKHGAAGLLKRLRAISVSLAVSIGGGSGI